MNMLNTDFKIGLRDQRINDIGLEIIRENEENKVIEELDENEEFENEIA
jgi:hypothetical protein